MRLRPAVTLLSLGMLVLGGCGGSAVKRPQGPVIGAMFDGPVLTPAVGLDRQLDLAVSSGVESLRVSVDWATMQPYRSFSDVPVGQRAQFQSVGGVPTQYGPTDRIVGAAASRGLSLLPVVLDTPAWDGNGHGPASTPSSPAPYASFLRALVQRYGPHGTYWSTHPGTPRVPIRMWQVWNEPNFATYWSDQPFAPSYVKLLSAAHAAIKQADPGAQVVLAGLPEFSWEYLAQIYAQPAARQQFDVVAVHPYTERPAGVITILQRVRAVMDRAGDNAKPMLATEITWPSSQGKAPPQFGVGTTEQMQAQLLGQVMPLLQANRAQLGLTGFYWYTWMGNESPGAPPYGFNFAGLLRYIDGRVSPKPALAVFKRWALTLEHCTAKRSGSDCG